jgi:DNA-binding Lrp family transcriptional regulator
MIFGKNRPWQYADISILWELSKQGLPAQEIARRLGRSEESVLEKARELDIVLAPPPK